MSAPEVMNRESVLHGIKKGIVVLNKSVNMAVLTVIIAAILLSIYALTDISRVIVNGSSAQYAIYKPGETKQSFEELQEINPEVIGWITVYGTVIDYPITHAKDNDKYLMLGPDLKYSLLGSVFLDAGNKRDFSDFNNILYGHNMTPRAMFGNIKDYKDEAFFDAHRYGDLFYNDTHHGIIFFALYEEDGYSQFLKRTSFADDEDRQKYLNDILQKAIIKRDLAINVSTDRIVTLYTCSNADTNGRELLVGLITDETYEDPFYEAPAEESRVRRALTWLERVPLWVWPYLWLVILLIILFIVKHVQHRMEEKRRRKLESEAQGASGNVGLGNDEAGDAGLGNAGFGNVGLGNAEVGNVGLGNAGSDGIMNKDAEAPDGKNGEVDV